MKRLLFVVVAIVGSVALAGCRTMAPEYRQPSLPVPSAFPDADAGSQTGRPAAEIPWREFFGDEHVRSLIQLALANNRDLRTAVLDIERARALYRVQRSDLWPTVSAGATAQVERGDQSTSEQYSASVDVSSYELDLFGRIRSLNAEALHTYLATEQTQRAVQISLVSEVAQAYLTLAADQDLFRLAASTLQAQRASLELTRQRVDAGVANALALRQAQTSVESARVDVARYTTQVAQDRNALALVVGAPVPESLLPDSALDDIGALPDVPAGLPSEVLLRRPDIQAAEQELRAAYANIGAARAQLFPTVSLTTSGGIQSSALSGLLSGGTGAWSVIPQITVPIFNAGRNRANLKVAEVDRDLALASYEQTIQTAFKEVADALVDRSTLDERLAAQQALVQATSDSYQLSEARFTNGVDNYLAVLDAQRSLYSAQQGLIDLRLSRLSNLVTVYRVLGGGWTEADSQPPVVTSP